MNWKLYLNSHDCHISISHRLMKKQSNCDVYVLIKSMKGNYSCKIIVGMIVIHVDFLSSISDISIVYLNVFIE